MLPWGMRHDKKNLSPSFHEGKIQPNDCQVEKQTGKVCVKRQHTFTAGFFFLFESFYAERE